MRNLFALNLTWKYIQLYNTQSSSIRANGFWSKPWVSEVKPNQLKIYEKYMLSSSCWQRRWHKYTKHLILISIYQNAWYMMSCTRWSCSKHTQQTNHRASSVPAQATCTAPPPLHCGTSLHHRALYHTILGVVQRLPELGHIRQSGARRWRQMPPGTWMLWLCPLASHLTQRNILCRKASSAAWWEPAWSGELGEGRPTNANEKDHP